MVTTFCAGETFDSGCTHERTALPSTWTVQAPHWASPQPNSGPLRPRFSRSASRSGMSGSSTVIVRARPLTLSVLRSAM